MGGGKKGGGKAQVTDYYMSMHYGICHGPIDELKEILVGEKLAWSGSVTTNSDISISNTELFGGNKKEGGVAGTASFLSGVSTQVMPAALAAKLGLTSTTCPAYRGIASIFFHAGTGIGPGSTGSGLGGLLGTFGSVVRYGFNTRGFLWASNNPYLRAIWLKVKRSPKVLASTHRMIGNDANPAAIIYECLTNTDWGMGASPGTVNQQSFEDAAETLLNESFGLSLQWTKQTTIEAFVSEILDHIQATMFVNPRDGLMTIKLIRDDYDPADLPVLDPDNCEVVSFDRKAWGETINEIVVTWTNPENEQEETVSAQDLANVTIQGAVISDSRNYYGVRNAELAMQLAKRDLATASAPIATFEIEVDRSAWNFVPGGCVVLNYPDYGIDALILRIGKIDYGKAGQMTIKVNAAEDIFALPVAAYTVPDGTQWQDPSMEPVPMSPVSVITAPAYFAAAAINTGTQQADQLAYPDVYAAVLASDSAGTDVASYELVQQSVLPSGDVIGEIVATKPVLGSAFLQAALPAATTSVVASFGDVLGTTGPFVSGFVVIGQTSEAYQEIALIKSADESGWTLQRGVLDTVPRAWPIDTPVWFVAKTVNFVDTSSVRAATEAVRFKLLPRTARGTLAEDDAPIVGATLTARPHLPNRPANVTVAGIAFGAIDLSSSPPSTIAVTWANRNRTLEDNTVLAWTEPNAVPETGQTTTVAVYRVDGTLITAHDGLTGTSFSLPISSFGEAPIADVKVTSKRDGLESLQGLSIRVRVRPSAWGDNWGSDWGSTTVDTTIPPTAPTPEIPSNDPEPDIPWWKLDGSDYIP